MRNYDRVHPRKPEGIEKHKVYIVDGIADLSAAAFLADDAGMPSENIIIYEKRQDVGGCCGVIGAKGAYVCPGKRELEPHMLCKVNQIPPYFMCQGWDKSAVLKDSVLSPEYLKDEQNLKKRLCIGEFVQRRKV